MNELTILFGIICALMIIANLIISISISNELRKNGIDARIAHRRGIIFKYLKIYKDQTIADHGRPGKLYYLFIISFVLSMCFLFVGIILSSL